MRWWVQAFLILLLALGGTAGSALLFKQPGQATRQIDDWMRTPAQVSAMKNVLWVDARQAEQFEKSHINGALNVSLDDWETGFAELISAWSPDNVIVVYCDGEGCQLSRETAERLRQDLGENQVFWLQGGIEAWVSYIP